MEVFPNNPNVDGWGARKCKLQFAGPPVPMSMVTTYLTYSSFGMQNNDAHNSVDSVNVTQRVASTRNMSWGGMKTRIPCPGRSGQSKCLENQLFILFQHFAAYYTTLYYVDGQQVESAGTSPWCIIYDGHHGPSALKTH